MRSWDVLSPVPLKAGGEVTAAFDQVGAPDYRAAARYISRLPYDRNRDADAVLAVLREGRGTCSTKHALLRRLAMEQSLEVVLAIGIYEMDAQNTPAVGSVLKKHGLAMLPEAHCYLRIPGNRVDVTRENNGNWPASSLKLFHEEDIAPEQIGDYKAALHRQFLRQWIADTGAAGGRNLDEVWQIREECILALSNRAEAG